MSDKKFAKGFSVKDVATQYGKIIKIGIHKDKILENDFNENGYLNIDIMQSKENKSYAVINEYKG